MKEYILLVRLPVNYSAADAAAVRGKWTALTDRWKAANIFITSFVFPAEGYVVSPDKTAKKASVVSDDVKMVSSIVVHAASIEDALVLAQECPVLEQGGTIEVREVQLRTQPVGTDPAVK